MATGVGLAVLAFVIVEVIVRSFRCTGFSGADLSASAFHRASLEENGWRQYRIFSQHSISLASVPPARP
jgi:hypothetical protein